MYRWLAFALVMLVPSAANAGFSSFEGLGVPPNSYNNNAGSSGFFYSGGNAFNNTYSPDFGGFWYGWAISTMSDTTTPGFTNQYSAFTGVGAGGSLTYAIASTHGVTDPFRPDAAFVNLAAGTNPISIDVTNTTFGALSMLNGDDFAHKFGPGDYFRLTVTGYDSLNGVGGPVGAVEVYLANFLGSNSYVLDKWLTVDLASLVGAKSLRFALDSSDNHPLYGLNTPAYFAADNLRATPEPSTLGLIGTAAVAFGLQWLRRRRVALTDGVSGQV